MSERNEFDVSVGNGGNADANANAGDVSFGDLNTGGNVGNVVATENLAGNSILDAGTSSNNSSFNVNASGGDAHADASGGDYNIAFVS